MKYKLGELIESVSKTYDFSNKDSIIFVNTSDIFDGVITGKETKINELPGQAKKSIKLNDILFSEIRPKNKRFAMVTDIEPSNYVVSTKLMVLRNKKEKVLDTKYLYLYLTSPTIISYLQSEAESRSGTFPQITFKDNVSNIEINLPSLYEQHEVVRKIGTIINKIKLNKQINANLLKLAKGIYYHALALNETEETKLSDFATIVMGQSPSSKTYNEEKKGTALLNGATDFRNGIHPSKWTTDPKKIVSNGAYVFGVRATIGLTTKVFQQYAIGRGTGSAIPKNNIDDEFLYFILNDMFNYFRQTGSGSVYINISKQDFNNYTFAKPSDQVLLKFHQRVKPIMDYVYLNTQENNNLIKVRNNLLDKLF